MRLSKYSCLARLQADLKALLASGVRSRRTSVRAALHSSFHHPVTLFPFPFFGVVAWPFQDSARLSLRHFTAHWSVALLPRTGNVLVTSWILPMMSPMNSASSSDPFLIRGAAGGTDPRMSMAILMGAWSDGPHSSGHIDTCTS